MFNIPMQKVLELEKAESLKTPRIFGDYIIFEKFDGWYCYADFDSRTDTWSYVHSSRGRIIPAFKWTQRIFNCLPKPKESCRLIMEAIIPDMPFHIMNGLFNRSVGDCACLDVKFFVHDYIPTETYFITSREENFAMRRYEKLLECDMLRTDRIFEIVPIIDISPSKDVWLKHFDRILSVGGEGIVLKRAQSLYAPGKRNADMLKIKEEITEDLLCIDAYETIGEKGFANINLIFKNPEGEDTHVRLSKDEDILKFHLDKNNFIGKIGEIHAMKRTEYGTLYQPRFVRIRDDL